MNAGSSLSKYAPRESDYSAKTPWRAVRNLEGLQYVATSMLSNDPEILSHLRVRVNLGMSDASTSRQNRIKRFFKALQTYEHCKVLDLGHCQLSDHTCRVHVSKMLERNSFLTQIKLNDNAFTDVGGAIVFQAMSVASNNISKLNMANNNISRDTIDNGLALIKQDRFEELDFSYTEIGAHGVKLLAGEVKKLTKLVKLILEGVKAGDEGCLELAKAFEAGGNVSVTTLNLMDNHIGRVGIEALCKNFVPGVNEVVNNINLSKNYFGDQGMDKIKDMMKLNNSMKVLKLNKVGITAPKFVQFCEMLQERYGQEYGPYPDLQQLFVGNNGLGNPPNELFSMLKEKNCIIKKLGYDGNDVDNYGCKLFRYFFCGVEYQSLAHRYKNRKVVFNSEIGDSPEIAEKKRIISLRRNEFESLTLKGNLITEDGAEHLGELISGFSHLKELDVRKNKLGLKGAIFFKKAFRSMQCSKKNFENAERVFKLHVLPKDVTVAGVNHLAIGIREHAKTLKKHIESKSFKGSGNVYHKYERHPELQAEWDAAIGKREQFLEGESQEFIDKHTEETKNIDLPKDKFSPLFNRKVFKDNEAFHLGGFVSKFGEFDTMGSNPVSIEIYGENDEKENQWKKLMQATYKSSFIQVNERGVLKWNPDIYGKIKSGWGSMIANQLYRHGMLLRLHYYAESPEYIRDLYLHRYAKNNLRDIMRQMDANDVSVESLIARLVIDDIKDFWEVLMHQTSRASEGLTMFEFALKYGKSPLIDVVRQFINVFPAAAYAAPKSTKPAVFLLQQIAHSGKSYKDLCLASEDKFVKRYAQAKKLVLFRFLVIEPVYISKFVTISKVEDLLLTEEFKDEERFFYMRRIANTSAQKDENLSKNEFNAHRSFMQSSGKYLPDKPKSNLKVREYANPMDKVENLILKNENMNLDVGYMGQISQVYHRKQLLSDDSLMPTFTKIYKTNLREVLDNESLAGGRDLKRAQIMLKMLASALAHFNDRDWVKRTHGSQDGYKVDENALKPRCHGNVKPRNIILRNVDELPDLDKGDDYMPGKWVLSDFSRSTEHGSEYYPAADSAYNPPEVAKRLMSSGERHVKKRIEASEKIDVWQFGCVLFEVLSGTTLFKMEGNNDLIIDEEERGELVNWLSLDDERASLILNQLKSGKTYRSIAHSLSLNNNGNLSDEEIESVISAGKQLVQWCLQGDPKDRPEFGDILAHPFFEKVDIGRKKIEKEADDVANIFKIKKESWSNQGFLENQPHVHLINTDFDEAGTVIKSIEQVLSKAGCRLTTDSIKNVSPQEYEKQIKNNVQSARVLACLLTNDCFFKPNVVKQLLYGEDYRAKSDKPHGRILFLDLTGKVDLSKSGLTWNKEKFSKEWRQTDEFHYLVKSLAKENISLSNFTLNSDNYDDQYDTWNEFLKTQFRTMVLSYMKDQIVYQTDGFLRQPMVDRMLLDGHLVPTNNISKFSIGTPSAKNFKDSSDLLNKKMEDRKDKFMNLYFLPSNKKKEGAVRTYVLCASGQPDETFNAVSAIARALEKPGSDNLVDKNSRHKEETDQRNKLINKVKTSYNLKKDSHLKVGGRTRKIQSIKDSVLNITRKEGGLLLVIYATPGVFKRYSKFLHEAMEKRENEDIGIVLIASPGFKVEALYAEIEENVPVEWQEKFKNKRSYLQYFKNKQKTWLYEAFMSTVQKEAIKAIKEPLPKETFTA